MINVKRTRVPFQAGAFAVVGVIGFIVDAGLFIFMTGWLNWSTMAARTFAFVPATCVTWAINRSVVFSNPRRVYRLKTMEYANYLLVQGVGISINFCVFYLTLQIFPTMFPLIALALGSIVAMTFNFIGSKLVVFRD